MKIYYFDDEYNVYDDKAQIVGKIGIGGLMADDNNNLLYNGNVVGVIGGNLRELSQDNKMNKEKGNTRVLKKSDNAGFGQIMIVSLVLLCLAMLIGIIIFSFLG